MARIEIFARTEVGCVRERNEDSFLVLDLSTGDRTLRPDQRNRDLRRPGTLMAVCDGMGGHDDGHVASTTAARVVAKLFRPGAPKDPPRALLRYIQKTHRRQFSKLLNTLHSQIG